MRKKKNTLEPTTYYRNLVTFSSLPKFGKIYPFSIKKILCIVKFKNFKSQNLARKQFPKVFLLFGTDSKFQPHLNILPTHLPMYLVMYKPQVGMMWDKVQISWGFYTNLPMT